MQSSNGRVDIKSPSTCDLFKMYDKIPANQCATFRSPTEGLWDDTKLSEVFFSNYNIQILQNGIRRGVYESSNGQYMIGQQDCDSLKIVMRSVYLQNASNKPFNIKGQVEQLNRIVLNYCIQQVYGEAQGYMKYLDDASTLVVPLANPMVESTYDKQLELKPFF